MTTWEALTALRAPRAGLVRRLAALVYESLLLAALVILLSFALLPLVGPTGDPGAGEHLSLLAPAARVGSFACLFVVCAGYCVWLWSNGRRTLPMKTWGLAVRAADGSAPGVRQAAVRYLAWWTGPACAIAGYLALRQGGHGRWALGLLGVNYAWALVDPERQFLHDRIAGTRIIRL
jgi:uncharacterized RDD family membrane protein YckC